MIWRTFCVAVIVIILPSSSYCKYEGESCSTDNGPGTCVRLSSCSHLLEAVKRIGIRNLQGRLRDLSCGFDHKDPLLCCEAIENGHPGLSTSSTDQDLTTHNDPYDPDDYNPTGNKLGSTDLPNRTSNIQSHRNLRLLPTICGSLEGDRIIGGARAGLYEFPWMVLFKYEHRLQGTTLVCEGTLITERYVLTAAHCVTHLGSLRLTGVILGEHDTRQDPDCEVTEGEEFCAPRIRNINIETIKTHPEYKPDNRRDDIALLKLSEPADFSQVNMKPICLPTTEELGNEDLAGKTGTATGWGVTELGTQSPVLLSVDLPILSNQQCRNIFRGNPAILDTHLCAGGIKSKDVCGADSGGPLMVPGKVGSGRIKRVQYVQRGIVAFGSKKCGVAGVPGVFTRVAKYMDWILDNID